MLRKVEFDLLIDIRNRVQLDCKSIATLLFLPFKGETMSTELTLDTINNTNLKTVGEANAWSLAQKAMNDASHASRLDKIAEISLGNLVGHQGRMMQLSEMVIGKFGENATSMDPLEAISTSKLIRSESDSALTSVLAALSSGQISAKIAQSTPPTSASDTGFAGLLAMNNTLNQQNYSNNTTNSSLAAAMIALSAIMTREPVVRDTGK
jgi:hypothetical protein